MASCSFDNHVLSVLGTLMVGATLVMLRPDGNIDLQYLAEVLREKQITCMHAVPTLLNSLFDYLKEKTLISGVDSLRTICSGG
jgi:non-ribosomal peptide synthetase component F